MTWGASPQQLRSTARELATTQPGGLHQVARRSHRHGRKRPRHPHAAQLGLAAQRQLLRSGRNRPHQRPAKAGSTSQGRGSRLGQRPAHFEGRVAEPRHGRSRPSARPARRPRRTFQLSTQTGSARRPTVPNRPTLPQRATRPGRPAAESVRSRWSSWRRPSGSSGQPPRRWRQRGWRNQSRWQRSRRRRHRQYPHHGPGRRAAARSQPRRYPAPD